MMYSDLEKRLKNSKQDHLLEFYNVLEPKEQQDFLENLSQIDYEEMNQLFERAMKSLKEDVQKLDDRMEQIPPSQFESEEGIDKDKLEEYRQKGFEEIANGHVAVVLLAGGQGTRLGVPYPKGMYSVGLPSGKCLFQIQAERIQSVINLAEQQTGNKGKICWYIMTSGPTNDSTKNFLKKHNYFGLNPDDIVLFEQGLLPCFDYNGKIIMKDKLQMALAPDGNGGIYKALHKNGILDDMERRKIKYVHVHSVDNILVKVADPVFVGYCVTKDADCGAKVVRKSSPSEPVGVVCQVDGRFQVVEYSEITERTANLRNAHGELIFRAGNICNHFFTVDFLNRIAKQHEKELKLHVAKKRIPFANKYGDTEKPDKPNGIKIEKFVFDVFQFTDKFVTWEVPRVSEFSALKNSNDVGKDCPSTARVALLRLHRLYIEQAGGKVSQEEVEISPLLSYSGENLENIVKGKVFDEPTILLPDSKRTSNGCVCNGNRH